MSVGGTDWLLFLAIMHHPRDSTVLGCLYIEKRRKK